MSALRLPLLYAFAGGCLSSALLFGVWRAGAESGAAAAKQRRSPPLELVASAASAATAAPRAEQQQGPVVDVATEHDRVQAEEPTPQATQPADNRGTELAGSAVSDVLTDLEAAYRARVAAAAPARASSTQEHAVAVAPPDNAIAVTESSPVSASPPAAMVIPIVPAPTAPPAPTVAPVALAPAAALPEPPAAPAFAPQDDPRPTEVHIGDVNQNTYITNVRQGDVYQIQMQQLVMLQYMQLLGMSPGLAAPARHGRGAGARAVPFTSTITNPDNPWGFKFAPPHLVH